MGRLLNSVIGFVLIPIYTRYLTPADYGLYSLYAIAGQVVTLISLMGMSTAMFREVVYHNSDERTVISTTFNFLIIQSLVFFGVLAIFSTQISLLLFGEATHAYLLRLIFITNGLGVFGFVVLSTLQMREQAGRYSAVHVTRFGIGVALNILFIVVLRMGLEGLVLAGLVMSIVSAILFVALLWKDLRPRLSLAHPQADAALRAAAGALSARQHPAHLQRPLLPGALRRGGGSRDLLAGL